MLCSAREGLREKRDKLVDGGRGETEEDEGKTQKGNWQRMLTLIRHN